MIKRAGLDLPMFHSSSSWLSVLFFNHLFPLFPPLCALYCVLDTLPTYLSINFLLKISPLTFALSAFLRQTVFISYQYLLWLFVTSDPGERLFSRYPSLFAQYGSHLFLFLSSYRTGNEFSTVLFLNYLFNFPLPMSARLAGWKIKTFWLCQCVCVCLCLCVCVFQIWPNLIARRFRVGPRKVNFPAVSHPPVGWRIVWRLSKSHNSHDFSSFVSADGGSWGQNCNRWKVKRGTSILCLFLKVLDLFTPVFLKYITDMVLEALNDLLNFFFFDMISWIHPQDIVVFWCAVGSCL